MSGGAQLAHALVAALDDEALDLLAARLASRLATATQDAPGRAAYTVAALAAELSVSERTVRNAIERGELHAVKRGGRWLIGADAVRQWSAPGASAGHASDARRPAPRNRATRPGDSLAAVVAQLEREGSHRT